MVRIRVRVVFSFCQKLARMRSIRNTAYIEQKPSILDSSTWTFHQNWESELRKSGNIYAHMLLQTRREVKMAGRIYSFLFIRMFYKNIEGEIGEILRII